MRFNSISRVILSFHGHFIQSAILKMSKERCYVCSLLTNNAELNGLCVKTIHTRTEIVEHIRRLLAADKSISVPENANICLPCLHKFNQYDLTCATVRQMEAELRREIQFSRRIHFKEKLIELDETVEPEKARQKDASPCDFPR